MSLLDYIYATDPEAITGQEIWSFFHVNFFENQQVHDPHIILKFDWALD